VALERVFHSGEGAENLRPHVGRGGLGAVLWIASRLALVALFSLSTFWPAPGRAAAAEEAYQAARQDFLDLVKDEKRKRYRDQWMRITSQLDRSVERLKGQRQCEALFNSGRAWHELSRISYLHADRREGIQRFEKLVERCPTSNLADDSLFLAAELWVRMDPAQSRQTLERLFQRYPKGDMVPKGRELLAELPPPAAAKATAVAVNISNTTSAASTSRAASSANSAKLANTANSANSTRPAGTSSQANTSNTASSSSVAGSANAANIANNAGTVGTAGTTGAAGGAGPIKAAARGEAASSAAPAGAPGAGKDAGSAAAGVTQNATVAAAAGVSAAARLSAESSGRGTTERGEGEPRSTTAPSSPATSGAAPGSSLPSAMDILAALDAKGADAHRPEDLALAEDLAKDREVAAPAGEHAAPDRERMEAIRDAVGGEIPLSLAAGLKVKRVVIDPGHGGKDTGAIGRDGTREKDLTLAISKKLKTRLAALGLEVFLTRETDVFLSLEERTRFANDKRADLFISVHINAAENRKAHGIETYTLNLNSDRYAMRLAARENATSERSIGDLDLILADLATKANTDDSVRLARHTQDRMVQRLRSRYKSATIRDLGVKQALFFVLVGAKMPAILVEAGFISNADEARRLKAKDYQDEIARSISDGVRRFIDEREAIARGEIPSGATVF